MCWLIHLLNVLEDMEIMYQSDYSYRERKNNFRAVQITIFLGVRHIYHVSQSEQITGVKL